MAYFGGHVFCSPLLQWWKHLPIHFNPWISSAFSKLIKNIQQLKEQNQQPDRTDAGPQCWNRGPETLGMNARHRESWEGPRGKQNVDGQEGILFSVSRRETAEQFWNILAFGTTLWLLTQYQPFLVRTCWALLAVPFPESYRCRPRPHCFQYFSSFPTFCGVLFFPLLLFFCFSNSVSYYFSSAYSNPGVH